MLEGGAGVGQAARGVEGESCSRQRKSMCKAQRYAELHEARCGWSTEAGSTVPSSSALYKTGQSPWHTSRGLAPPPRP